MADRKLFIPEADVIAQVRTALESVRIPAGLLEAVTDHLEAGHTAEVRYHVDSIAGLRRQYDQVRERLGTLPDLRLDKSITQAEYDEKARALKTQQAEIANG